MKPFPVSQSVCDSCGEPWPLHLALADALLDPEEEWADAEGVIHDAETDEEIGPLAERIDHAVCIAVLRERFRGPAGAPGPQGPAGMRGEPGPSIPILGG